MFPLGGKNASPANEDENGGEDNPVESHVDELERSFYFDCSEGGPDFPVVHHVAAIISE